MSKNFYKDLQIFFVFFLFMIPFVFLVSTQDSFLVKYPFYRLSSVNQIHSNFLIWEFFYFLQFVSLEFFFRGFMVHGLKKQIGDYSVLVMIIPYCMIHFQKPFLETIGAIFAGLILGYLSLRKESIFTGIALHFSVAVSMDIFALYHLELI
ncbi:MAG: CPBP family intramembrane metalloprotease [Crocinitomicaceae bacterium]|nr:CPBP family intramembrane metalloprotease [Crocinitomicaceae bacterium]